LTGVTRGGASPCICTSVAGTDAGPKCAGHKFCHAYISGNTAADLCLDLPGC
jgi:hypothetical protein